MLIGAFGWQMQHSKSSVLGRHFKLAGSTPPADLVTSGDSWETEAVINHLGALSIWLRDGDEALGSGDWLDSDGAVASCQAQHCLRLPIRVYDSDCSRGHLRSQISISSGSSLSERRRRADGCREG